MFEDQKQPGRPVRNLTIDEATKDECCIREREMRGIGWAVKQMHLGMRVRRAGWNGKGMYIVLQGGYPQGIGINRNTALATGIPEGVVCKFLPYVMMKTVDDAFVPWLCSQTDLLAFDWEIAL